MIRTQRLFPFAFRQFLFPGVKNRAEYRSGAGSRPAGDDKGGNRADASRRGVVFELLYPVSLLSDTEDARYSRSPRS